MALANLNTSQWREPMEIEIIACPFCLGDGIDKFKRPCWACDGTGEVEYKEEEDDFYDEGIDEIDF